MCQVYLVRLIMAGLYEFHLRYFLPDLKVDKQVSKNPWFR